VTAGNRHDVTQLVPLLDRVPPIRGARGRPWRRPGTLYADRAYDHRPQRRELRRRGIRARIARRGHEHGSGEGRHRWPVEQTIALVHRYKRLLVCFDRTLETHRAWLDIACCLICWRRLQAAGPLC
jgi:IS5 family transposase